MYRSDNSIDIIPCICCWYDLLGFGTPFVEAKWDLLKKEAEPSIKRIINEAIPFSGLWSNSYAKKLHLNDDIITNYDIDKSVSHSVDGLLLFLDAIITDFEAINTVDKNNGFPGVRGVITYGDRVCYVPSDITTMIDFENKRCYHPKEFQMNTAFSKAFIVEESGSKFGIYGSYLYIDSAIIDLIREFQTIQIIEEQTKTSLIITINRNNAWMATYAFDSETIPYNYRGIDTTFYRLKSKHTIIDDCAKELAHKQSLLYSTWEE